MNADEEIGDREKGKSAKETRGLKGKTLYH